MLRPGEQDPSSSSKRRSAFELKNQLSDLQNKLMDNQQVKIARKRHSTSHLSDIDPSDENLDIPRLPNVFGRRNKEGSKRNSLPTMPLNAGANQPGRAASDVSFVVGLSENLLLECRRLTAESSQYKVQLKEAEEELERVNKQLTNITVINKKFMEEEDSLKDKNWELEGSLLQLKEKLNKLSGENQKLSQSKIEAIKSNDQLQNELEQQKLNNLSLTDELSTIKQKWSAESKYLKTTNENLNDENDVLQKTVMDLKEEISDLKSAAKENTDSKPSSKDFNQIEREESDSDNEFSIIDDPRASESNNAPVRNVELEKETLKTNLMHSNKTITKLKSTILKLRTEKEELESKFSTLNSSPNVSAKFSSPIMKKRGKMTKSPKSLLSNETVKTLTFDEENVTTEDDWEGLSFNESPVKVQHEYHSSSSEDESQQNIAGRKLLSQELEQDPLDVVNKYVLENNLVLVNAIEYKHLKGLDTTSNVYEKENSAIVTAAKQFNILALPTEDGSHHIKIPVKLLKQKCSEENLVLVDRDEYEELLDIKNNEPSEAELIEKISKFKRVTLPTDEYEKLVDISQAPSFEFLKTKLFENYDQVSVEKSEFESLQHPSLNKVKELALEFDHDLLPIEKHKRLLEKVETPSLEFLKAKLYEDYNQVAIEESELNSLKSPSSDKIKDLASNNGLVALAADVHANLIDKSSNPTLEDLKLFAEAHGHTAVPNDHYQDLQRQLTNPTSSQLYQYATAAGFVLLNQEAHKKLSNSLKSPSLQYLKSKLSTLDHIVVPKDEFSLLTDSANETIEDKANQENLFVIPKDEFTKLDTELKDLRDQINTPSVEYLKDKATSNGYELVNNTRYNELVLSESIPISEKAENEGKILLDKTTYETLVENIESPAMDYLEEKSTSLGKTLVSVDELKTLYESKLILESPSVDFLQAKAAEIDHQLISNEGLAKLESLKTKEGIHSTASTLGLSVIEESKLSELLLLQSKLENITVSDVEDYASKLKLSAIETEKLEYLKKLVENPSIEDLKSHEANLNVVVLPSDEHKELTTKLASPPLDYLTEKAKDLNHKIMPEEEISELTKNAHSPSIEHLTIKSSLLGHTLIPVEELRSLQDSLDHPDIQFLTSKANSAGYQILPTDELIELKKSADESLDDKAAKLDSIVVKESEFQRLSNLETNPSVSFLRQKSENLGYHLIDEEESKNLKETSESPTKEFISKKAAFLGLAAIPLEEHDDLIRKTTTPTLEEIKEYASGKDMVVISSSQKHELQHPSLETITAKASEMMYSLLPSSELIELKESIQSPTVSYLKEKSANVGYVLLPSEEHDNMRSNILEPDLAYIIEKADKHGHKVLPNEKVSELEILLSESLIDKAAKENLVVLAKEEHDELISRANESLEEKSKRLEHVALPENVYLELIKSKEELDSKLLNPDRDYLESKAESLGLALIEKEKLDSLVASESETLEEKAKRLESAVLSFEKHKQLIELLENPDVDYLIEKAQILAHSVIPSSELESLKEKSLNPTQEDLEKHAKSRDSLILSLQTYNDLQSKVSEPSLEFLKEKASAQTHVVVPSADYDLLILAQDESLEEKAKKMDSVIVSKVVYENLSKLELNPSLEFLKNKAQMLDHKLVPIELWKELKELNEEPLLSKANKEGLILLSGEEYSELQSKIEAKETEILALEEKQKNVDESALIDLATALNLVVLKIADYTKLSEAAVSPPLDQLVAQAAKKDHVLLPKWKYEVIERKATKPNEDEIESFATKLGKKLIDPDELERLTLESSKPSRDILSRTATELGLVLIPTKEYEFLKSKLDSAHHAAAAAAGTFENPAESTTLDSATMIPENSHPSGKNNKVIDTKHLYEEMIKQENEKQAEGQKVVASKALGIVSLSTDEYKMLLTKLQVPEPTISEIYNGAKNFGLTVLPHADYKALLKRQDRSETKEGLENSARLLGFTIMPLNLSRNQSAISLTDDDFHDAVSHQSSKLSLVSNDDYEDALSRQLSGNEAETVYPIEEPFNLETLKEKASEYGFDLVPIEDTYESDGDVTSIEDIDTEDNIKTSSQVEDLASDLLKADSEEKLMDTDEKSQESEESQRMKLSLRDILDLAPDFGLKVLSKEEYDDLCKEPSDERLEEILSSRQKTVISEELYNKLNESDERSNSAPTLSSLSLLALPLGLVVVSATELEDLKHTKPLSQDEIRALTENEGLVTLTKDLHERLQKASTKEIDEGDLRKKAKEMGLVTITSSEYDELQNHKITEMDLVESASDFGLLVIAEPKLSALKEGKLLNEEQLRTRASELGLLLIPKENLSEYEEDSPLEENDLRNRASALGLLVIAQSRLLQLENIESSTTEELKSSHSPSNITEDELRSRASEFGMSLISKEDLKSMQGSDISANDLAMKAAELDLVLISQRAYDDLKNTQVAGDGIEDAARKLGLLCIPETSYIPTTVAPKPNPNNVVMVPKTYYNKLARSHTLSVERLSKESLIEHCKKRGLIVVDQDGSESGDVPHRLRGNSIESQKVGSSSPVLDSFNATSQAPTTPNMVSSPSQFSLATNISLTDRKMIPALTQTIIGEYLYKYYRRLGPFSSISENRHERYFWIHPYSLTLYWSSTNPVLDDPSSNKIRAAAILGVEAITDNNPLPPGLYHKSIIIHSSDKSIRITCPTRQRHNVWFNSIRYLLERSSDGSDMADVLENPSAARLPTTIEEEGEDNDDNDIDNYRYVKPRASMVKPLRTVSNPVRRSTRIFSHSHIPKSSTSGSLRRKN